ncbi:uncharacterized protein LOC114884496 isoform X2 [Monodon monoceros]|uniref:uncharacterized protein LOC114884496 isoform X2 n=1 Tax=Monodon monoceros TaxID=40151 RepID=UPI0010FA4B1F|nr:uncharacterized protein LOC114884496 isoform X2 [Monodon monoceros]
MSSGVALRLRTLQRHLGSPEVWTQGSFPVPLVAQGRGMEPGSSLLTTHVLDTASGLPAEGLCLRLSRLEDHGQQWTELRKSAQCPWAAPEPQVLEAVLLHSRPGPLTRVPVRLPGHRRPVGTQPWGTQAGGSSAPSAAPPPFSPQLHGP